MLSVNFFYDKKHYHEISSPAILMTAQETVLQTRQLMFNFDFQLYYFWEGELLGTGDSRSVVVCLLSLQEALGSILRIGEGKGKRKERKEKNFTGHFYFHSSVLTDLYKSFRE